MAKPPGRTALNLAAQYGGIQVAKATNWNVTGPMIAFIEVTKKCSFKCSFCDIWRATDETTDEMSHQDLLRVIADLKELGTKYVGLFGGEPLQRKDLFDLVAAMKEAGLGVVLVTNGYLLPEYHDRVVSSGVDTLAVSMDSARAEVHDRLRGRNGSHGRIVDGLRAVRARSDAITLVINTVIMTDNYRELVDVLRLGAALGVRHFRLLALNFIYPYNMRHMQASALALNDAEIQELGGELERVIAYAESIGVTLNSHRFLRGIPTFYEGRREPEPCFAGYASVSIHNDGRLAFCSSLAADIGNVRERRLIDIWRSRQFKDERTRMMSEPCNKCYVSCFIEQNHWFTPSVLLGRLMTAH